MLARVNTFDRYGFITDTRTIATCDLYDYALLFINNNRRAPDQWTRWTLVTIWTE